MSSEPNHCFDQLQKNTFFSWQTSADCCKTPHGYTLDLSTYRFLPTQTIHCGNMQANEAIAALAAHTPFPTSSCWISTRDPPSCVEPGAGSWTVEAQPSSGTCPASNSLQVWPGREQCPFLSHSYAGSATGSLIAFYYALLPLFKC